MVSALYVEESIPTLSTKQLGTEEMTLRMPKDIQGGFMPKSGASVLHAELVAEQAASLGIAGRKVARTMADLQDVPTDDSLYEERLNAAAQAVYHYFVQRELNGITNNKDAIEHYGIGPDVLSRLGKIGQHK